MMGGFEPDLNGFLNQKQSATTAPQEEGVMGISTAGRVEPHYEWVFDIDQRDRTHLPFPEGKRSGVTIKTTAL